VSLNESAIEERQWRGLTNLRSALSKKRLDDHHYGYSSAHYNKFESLSDLLMITLLVLENIDKIPYEVGHETGADLAGLSEEIKHRSADRIQATRREFMDLSEEVKWRAEQLSDLSDQLKEQAEEWAQKRMRALFGT
jgi:FtsZ-binding cell division protein ZapB